MRLNSATQVGRSKKLQPVWKGPFVIAETLAGNIYQVAGCKKVTVQHSARMRLFVERAVPFWVQRKRVQLVERQGEVVEPTEANFGGTLPALFGDSGTGEGSSHDQPPLVGTDLSPGECGTVTSSPTGTDLPPSNPDVDDTDGLFCGGGTTAPEYTSWEAAPSANPLAGL